MMIVPSSVARLRQSDIGQKLIRQAVFPAAASASGSFVACDAHDDWRLGRTSAWVAQHSNGLWRRTVNQPGGILSFEFEHEADAVALRTASATLPGMILCR